MVLSADDPQVAGKALRIVWGSQPEVRGERGRESHVPTQNENHRGYAQGIAGSGEQGLCLLHVQLCPENQTGRPGGGH